MAVWKPDELNVLNGKVALLTCDSDDAAPFLARELLRSGARVFFGGKDEVKGKRIERWLKQEVPDSYARHLYLDLTQPDSIKLFVPRFLAESPGLHLLFNNTAANYLGDFSITAQLFHLLKETADSRVIFQTGIEYRQGELDIYHEEIFANAQLAKVILALELHRRIARAGLSTRSVVVSKGARLMGGSRLTRLLMRPFIQPPELAGRALLFAATSRSVRSGSIWEPSKLRGRRGELQETNPEVLTKYLLKAGHLWEVSERLAGVKFSVEALDNLLVFPRNTQMKDDHHPPR